MTNLTFTRKHVPTTAFEVEIVEVKPGFISFLVNGEKDIFSNEAGGHRWQRIPPTERNGRVHTSTITVAVLPISIDNQSIKSSDISFETKRGSGPGGQHRNKTESCVVAKHIPTGITVTIDMRSQHQSKKIALSVLCAKVVELKNETKLKNTNQERKSQIGSGQRGDKIRTYRLQDNIMIDHRTNIKMNLLKWMEGKW